MQTGFQFVNLIHRVCWNYSGMGDYDVIISLIYEKLNYYL
jgi:hypothetical protein